MILAFFKKHLMQTIIYVVIMAVGAFGGYTFCKRAQYKGVIKQQQKDAKAVLKHQEDKENVDKQVRAAIEKLKSVKDTSACLDKPSGDEYLNELQRAINEAQSGFN